MTVTSDAKSKALPMSQDAEELSQLSQELVAASQEATSQQSSSQQLSDSESLSGTEGGLHAVEYFEKTGENFMDFCPSDASEKSL
jgi:hypothetical protein